MVTVHVLTRRKLFFLVKVVHLFVTSFVKKSDHFVFFRCSPLHLNGELQGPWFWESNGHLKWLSHTIIDDNTLTRTTRCSGFCYFCSIWMNGVGLWWYTRTFFPMMFEIFDVHQTSAQTTHVMQLYLARFFFRELYLDRQKGREGGWFVHCWTLDTQLVRNGCKYNETLRAYIAYRQPLNQAGSPMFLVLPTGETPKSSGCRADIKAMYVWRDKIFDI